MRIIEFKNISIEEYKQLLKRPSIEFEKTTEIVKPILLDIKLNGMSAVLKYAVKLDAFDQSMTPKVSEGEFDEAEQSLNKNIKSALETAANNIRKFHEKQMPNKYTVETMNGIECWREHRAIQNVGLYIPGGNAVLPSTILMLGIPAKLAGCERVFACSPSKNNKLHPAVLYAAKICGIDEIYKIGGAQAVGLMAYGTQEIKKADKIFGPGNQFVTAAKMIVANDPEGASIDMPAGPSEVLIIADANADPAFTAADLLAQAEHGFDSQSLLVTDNSAFAREVIAEIEKQIIELNRIEFARASLNNSFILIVENLKQALEFSNDYAPEHLIMNFESCDEEVINIKNAGSVFIGKYSPESAGDYASGTNHSLPTYGYAKSYGGIGVETFMKAITFQKLSEDGLKNLAGTVITLAQTESLQAHANAVKIRIKNGSK